MSIWCSARLYLGSEIVEQTAAPQAKVDGQRERIVSNIIDCLWL